MSVRLLSVFEELVVAAVIGFGGGARCNLFSRGETGGI